MTLAQKKLKSAMDKYGATKVSRVTGVSVPALFKYIWYPEKQNGVNPQQMKMVTAVKFLKLKIGFMEWFEDADTGARTN